MTMTRPLAPEQKLTPAGRSTHSRVANYARWAKADPVAGTQKAREAFLSHFERQVDPEGHLDPAERSRRAESARSAYFTKLVLQRHKAAARRRGATKTSGWKPRGVSVRRLSAKKTKVLPPHPLV